MTTFPFDALPMEMKEMVLEKVDPRDSLKLLYVNRQLRNYTAHHGPWYNKLWDGVRLLQSPNGFAIYQPGWFRRLENFPLSTTRLEILRRLMAKVRSTRSILLEQTVFVGPHQFEHSLSEISRLFPVVERFELTADTHLSMLDLFDVYRPRVLKEFNFICQNTEIGLTFVEEGLPVALRVMLTECEKVCLGREANFLLKLLSELNVRKIYVVITSLLRFRLVPEKDWLDVIRKTLSNGLPSRNPDAEICYLLDKSDANLMKLTKFLTETDSIKEIDSNQFEEDYKRFAPYPTGEGSQISTFISDSPKKLALVLHHRNDHQLIDLYVKYLGN